MVEARERIDKTGGQIDVLAALADLDIQVLFRPLVGLLGAYMPKPTPGVLISTKRRLPIQRFTAAHELGHAVMAHEPSLDSKGVLRKAATGECSAKDGSIKHQLQEIEADSFAAEFISPRWLIAYHAKKRGWSSADLSNPDVAYQLSLRIGSSYEASLRSLERHQILDRTQLERALSKRPKSLKAHVSQDVQLPHPWADTWRLTGTAEKYIPSILVGDFIRLDFEDGHAVMEVSSNLQVVSSTTKGVGVIARGAGEGRILTSSSDELTLQVLAPEQGLSRANRARLIVAL